MRIAVTSVSVFLLASLAFGGNYVHICSSGRYFQLHDGTGFVPIGSNEAMNWPEMLHLYPNHKDTNRSATERYFQTLHQHGVNCIRIMAEAPNNGIRSGGAFQEEPVAQNAKRLHAQLSFKRPGQTIFQLRISELKTGELISESVLMSASETLTISLPRFEKDLALIVSKQD